MLTRRILPEVLVPARPGPDGARASSPARPAPPGRTRTRRVLVVVQLDGGNDGLNTARPASPTREYAEAPPAAQAGRRSDSIKLNDAVRPAPVAAGRSDKLLEAGQLAVVPGVGYPNPNRSHFESMAIWHTARFDPEEHKGYGWLGRALDAAGGELVRRSATTSRGALRGRRSAAVALTRPEDLTLADAGTARRGRPGRPRRRPARVRPPARGRRRRPPPRRWPRWPTSADGAGYPAHRPRPSGCSWSPGCSRPTSATRVFYTTQGGYDTHAAQQFAHANLLDEFAGAVNAFFADLQPRSWPTG